MRFLAHCLILAVAVLSASGPVAAVEPRLREVEPGTKSAPLAALLAQPDIEYDMSKLPAPVARLRDQLMDAARSGDLDRLKPIIEGNDMVPKFSFGDEEDPIAFWKDVSGDGQGREVLAIMLEVLQAGFVRTMRENEPVTYVWPYFAEIPLSGLTPKQEVELYTLVTAQDRRDMEDFGAYNFFRLGIAEDGQWLYFVAGD